MFPLLLLLFIIFDVTYILLETFTSIIRGRRKNVDAIEEVMKRSIKTRQFRQENVSIKTPERLVKRQMRPIRRRNTHFRLKLIQHCLTAYNTSKNKSNSEFYLFENKDQITNKDVLASRLKMSPPINDLCLTTDSRTALSSNSVLYALPFAFPCPQVDVSAAIQVVRVFDTMIAAVNTCLFVGRSFDYPRRYKNHGERTGMEVALYQPHHFHLTLDLTVACDVARSMYKSIPSGPAIHIDYHRFTLVDIPSELLAGLDGVPQIISEDTEVGGDDKSCEGTISSSCQQQAEVGEPKTSHQRNEKQQDFQAILYDEDMIGPKPYAAPRELIKWEEECDITDCDLDLHQVEGWEAADMLKVNEAYFNYQSTFNEAMSEYTTVLIKEDTPEYKLRYERACRLEEEILSEKRSEQEAKANRRKRR